MAINMVDFILATITVAFIAGTIIGGILYFKEKSNFEYVEDVICIVFNKELIEKSDSSIRLIPSSDNMLTDKSVEYITEVSYQEKRLFAKIKSIDIYNNHDIGDTLYMRLFRNKKNNTYIIER